MSSSLPRAAIPPAITELTVDHEWLTVTWSDGPASRFPALWLRDNLPEGRHAPEGQRTFDIATLPAYIELGDAVLNDDGRLAVTFQPEGLTAIFEPDWLRGHDLSAAARAARRRRPTLWDAGLQERLPEQPWQEAAEGGPGLLRFLRNLDRCGLAILRGGPAEPETVFEAVSWFGYVRETNYGRLFDVVSLEAPSNLAFTGLALGLHTDNPYRDPVPGLQLLHCLEASAEGGESLAVDGFAVAERLRAEAPQDFALLARHAVPFRYLDRKAGVDLSARAPLIELDDEGQVVALRYNNRSAAPFDLPAEVLPEFYRAYRRFGRLLHEAGQRVAFRLAPGDLFAVDNRRVLHGRTGYGGGFGGRRRLQGCYADKDGLRSRLAILEAELEGA
ncbi:gamma-butyrobetaine dioxygenase [Tistlia consotensis]|uniref:Gamma-butyrobetaine dioxygenase n=1 Tax=Tistlia consotensis USBA 355 TaxID=560819 RepID=A0A1Y6CWZ8_9PROT|nr:TauD/TfdA family dioxygenase [Tistlia consotensis]SMF82586.1 gamma-butyrobetaine dioxygenase [Tistlia consotensis USBA 355]SNS29475.1 gamma-butyrobetaine dioxygenase [Tistlia consotensis]